MVPKYKIIFSSFRNCFLLSPNFHGHSSHFKMENFIAREPDEKRQRKRTSFDPVTCPVCGITIRESELDQHYKSELEKLNKIKRIVNKSPCSSPGTSKGKVGEGSSSSKNDAEENCWDTYQKIKENRARRHSKVNKNIRCPRCYLY